MAYIGQVFRLGDTVETSGIYEVEHDPNHAQKHEVTCVWSVLIPRAVRSTPFRGFGDHRRLSGVRIHIRSRYVPTTVNATRKV